MWKVMTACVIMHNMIVEDERDEGIHDQGWEFQDDLVAPYPEAATFEEFLHVHKVNRTHESRSAAKGFN
jgi:hypothetical protein